MLITFWFVQERSLGQVAERSGQCVAFQLLGVSQRPNQDATGIETTSEHYCSKNMI